MKKKISKKSAGPKDGAARVAALEQRHRDAGEVQRKRWAHPDDWPKIDALISELRAERKQGT